MKIIPAIDILGNNFVRLTKGNFKKKIILKDQNKYLKSIIKRNPKIVHIIDLDGSKTGILKNKKKIINKIIPILRKNKIRIQLGGGIRKKKEIYFFLKKKIKVIISTLFFEKKIFFKRKKTIKKIIVSVDFKKNEVFCKGWKKKKVSIKNAIRRAKKSCFKYFIFTDIERDGTMKGLNIKKIKYICKKLKKKKIMFAGGFLKTDVNKVNKIKNLYGLIAGKFFYEKCIKE
ncbi:HisA/HisF-related TIM barrel protein [Candidatus Vidania fulgoroideorum]